MPDLAPSRWTMAELVAARASVRPDAAALLDGAGAHSPLSREQRIDEALRARGELRRPLVEVHREPEPTGSPTAVLRELGDAGADQFVLELAPGQPTGQLTREIIKQIPHPVGIRASGPDPRAAVDDFLAGGGTYYSLGLFDQLARSSDPAETIRRVQYADRLAGFYAENGVPVVRQCAGSAGGGLTPPALALAGTLIDGALAVAQGVPSVVLTYDVLGNLVQDVAAIHALRLAAASVLGELRADVQIYVAASQWYTELPADKGAAYALALAGTSLASLGRADVIVNAPPRDFAGGPAASVRTARQTLNLLSGQLVDVDGEVADEMDRMRVAIEAIVAAVSHAGDGDLVAGLGTSAGRALLDDLRSASPLGVRDGKGAVRWAREPQLPLPGNVVLADGAVPTG